MKHYHRKLYWWYTVNDLDDLGCNNSGKDTPTRLN